MARTRGGSRRGIHARRRPLASKFDARVAEIRAREVSGKIELHEEGTFSQPQNHHDPAQVESNGLNQLGTSISNQEVGADYQIESTPSQPGNESTTVAAAVASRMLDYSASQKLFSLSCIIDHFSHLFSHFL